jgi:hypothetical protein
MQGTMHVLLAVDGSEEAQDAARSLSSLAPLQSVTVLYVLDIPTWTYPTIVPEIESGCLRHWSNSVNKMVSI